MADKTLQKRSMRKAVARVDVGVFGIPMRYAAWMRAKRSSWSGLIAVSAGQGAAGLVVALLAGFLLGVPSNAFSLTLLMCFVIGSAIGGPLSFLLWSLLLLGVTGLLAGYIGGAWVASPAWWRALATDWSNGKNVPSWFLIAVPGWILLWIGGSYGVARLVDRIYESMSLSISFKAATRFSSEDQRIRDEAFAESNVSPVESRSLIDNGTDGTEAIIAGKPQKVEQGTRGARDLDLGGEPDAPPPSYDNLLEEDMDDPDVRRAMGLSARAATAPEAIPDVKSTAFMIERDEPVAPSAALPPELSEPDLPAVPSDNGAPLRRVTPPKVDALASRAMSKKLQQLLTSFEMALFEDKDEDFIRTNQDELALISEEQKAMLRAMDNSGPLLSAISAVQRERASEFLMGRAAPPVADGTGTISVPGDVVVAVPADGPDGLALADAADAADASAGVVAASGDEDAEEGVDTGQVVVADSVSKMGSIFSSMTRRGRAAKDMPVDDRSADPQPLATEVAETTAEPAVAADLATDESAHPLKPMSVSTAVSALTGAAPVDARGPDVVSGFVIPRPPGEVRAASSLPAPASEPVSQAFAEPVASPSDRDAAGGSEPDGDADPELADAHAGEISSVSADGTVVVFEMDIEEPEHVPVAVSDGLDARVDDTEVEEDEMSSLVFSRRVCREVIGLITGTLPPFEKANDVLEYERESGFSVAQILNSRSFDEHVGSTEAVAARHTWIDVQRILSQSGVERLVSDFERLNARGQAMVEEPHTLTAAAFFAFETECTRMLTAASVNDDTISASLILMDRNREILEALRDLRDRRDAARAQPAGGSASTVVRQRVPVGEDVEATRGRSMLQTLLGGARSGRDLLRSGDAQPAAAAPDESVVVADAVDDVAPVPDPASILEDAPVATRVPAYGDEDYESSHATGTSDYDFDMEMHGHALAARRRMAAQAAEKAEREARERKEQSEREESERQEKLDAEERERQRVVDAQRETERRRLLEGDQNFINAERERTEAAARAATALADEAAANAAAALVRAEREARENARSEEDQRILDEHRARLDGNTLPARFRERDIPVRFLKLTDLRDQRKKFQSMVMRDKIVGLDGVPEAIASPAKRSAMMMEVMIGAEAMGIYESILAVLDPENAEDLEFVRNMVPDGEDRRFVVSIQDAISLGKTSENALREADDSLLQMRQAVTALEGVSELSQDLARTTGELAQAAEREAALRRDLESAATGSQQVADERDRLRRELEALTRKMSGVVDDDFQRLLEKYAKPVEDAPFQGVFLMISPNRSNIVMVVTTTPDALPGGVVRVGDRSMTLTEVVQIMFDNVKSFATDSMDAYFTTTNLQSLASGGTFTTSFTDRSVGSFQEMADIVDMKIDPEDLDKGE